MVDFVQLFRTSVARQVSRKEEPLSTSATARNGRSGEKRELHRVTPLRETGLARSCHATLRKPIRNRNKSAMIHFETSFNVPEQVSTFYVKRCNAC